MKRIKEYVDNMTTEGWITTAIIGALLIVIVIGTFAKLAGENNSKRFSMKRDVEIVQNSPSDSETDLFINKASDTVFVKSEISNEYVSNSATPGASDPVSYEVKKEEVEIALIIDENAYDVKNIISGTCGSVYMVTAYVQGPTLLTNSLKALFGDKVFGDFLPGNIIPTYHPDLKFKDIVITGNVARINLTGNFKETKKDSCDTALAIAQITETAKSYANIKSVEIYLGSKKVN